jgi:hypothetical protein
MMRVGAFVGHVFDLLVVMGIQSSRSGCPQATRRSLRFAALLLLTVHFLKEEMDEDVFVI